MSDTVQTAAHLGQGHVKIILDGRELEMKPSLHAAMTLSRIFGGLQAVIDRITRFDLAAIQQVIELGIQFRGSASQKQALAESIYKAGLTDDTGRLPEHCIEYVHVLMRGGRPVPEIGEDQDGGEGEPAKDPQ